MERSRQSNPPGPGFAEIYKTGITGGLRYTTLADGGAMETTSRRQGGKEKAATLYGVVREGFSKRMFEQRPEDVRKQTVRAFGREFQLKER